LTSKGQERVKVKKRYYLAEIACLDQAKKKGDIGSETLESK
jgi:hypothetical protein